VIEKKKRCRLTDRLAASGSGMFTANSMNAEEALGLSCGQRQRGGYPC